MLRDVLVLNLCLTCEHLIERVGEEPSLSLNGRDYYRVDCAKGICENGNFYHKSSRPRQVEVEETVTNCNQFVEEELIVPTGEVIVEEISPLQELLLLPRIGQKRAQRLIAAGITSAESFMETSADKLTEILNIDYGEAETLQKLAIERIKDQT